MDSPFIGTLENMRVSQYNEQIDLLKAKIFKWKKVVECIGSWTISFQEHKKTLHNMWEHWATFYMDTKEKWKILWEECKGSQKNKQLVQK